MNAIGWTALCLITLVFAVRAPAEDAAPPENWIRVGSSGFCIRLPLDFKQAHVHVIDDEAGVWRASGRSMSYGLGWYGSPEPRTGCVDRDIILAGRSARFQECHDAQHTAALYVRLGDTEEGPYSLSISAGADSEAGLAELITALETMTVREACATAPSEPPVASDKTPEPSK